MDKLILKLFSAVIFIFTVFATHSSIAQLKPGNLTQYTEQDGLPGLQLSCVEQDKIGFSWVGTLNCLARYDGYEFQRFYTDPNDTASIKGLVVWSMFEDKKGRMWSGCSPENLNVYNPVTKSFRHYEFKHLVNHAENFEIGILAMCEDNNERIYLGVTSQYYNINQGLLYYDKKEDKIKPFVTPDSLVIENVYKLISDKSGNVWILSYSGFFKINTAGKLSRLRFYDEEYAKTGDYFTDLKSDTDGHLWLTTWQSRVINFDPEHETYKIYSPDNLFRGNNSDLHANCLTLDKNENIWIGSNKGLHYFNRKSERFENFKDESNKQFEQAQILSLSIDSFGSLWIGTSSNGLFKYEERALLKSYSYNNNDKNSITPGWASNIYESRNGKIWFTTSGQGKAGGINMLDPLTGSIRNWTYKMLVTNVK